MQDWREQAQKNNIQIIDFGDCQFCGAPLERGITQCVDISSRITHMLNHNDGIKYMTIFMCVDAHALQHCEIHGRWNNHYHLSRLELILKNNISWNYKLSPLLSNVVNEYKDIHSQEIISPPKPKKRGTLTAYAVDNSESEEQYFKLVREWASGVYDLFSEGHDVSRKIATLFRERYSL